MKHQSLLAALALPLSLSPLALSTAAAVPAAPAMPSHKSLVFFHMDRENGLLGRKGGSPGAFLELTNAAP